MKAMVLRRLGPLADNPEPLESVELPVPEPGPGEVLVRVSACGVCHTELDEIEGRTAPPKLPVVLGHQVVGRVEELGKGAAGFVLGERVGIGWIHSSCGRCEYCRRGEENLCAEFRATGRDVDGGYAELLTAPAESVYRIPEEFTDIQAAPLLCAGAIGYRSLRLAGVEDGERLGLFGFGASAHIVLQLARHLYPRTRVFVFARSREEREFALALGAAWAGDFGPEVNHRDTESEATKARKHEDGIDRGDLNITERTDTPFGPRAPNPEPVSGTKSTKGSDNPRSETRNPKSALLVPPLHAAIDTTPVWKPVLSALERLAPGGRLVVNAIRKEEADKDVLLGLDYPKQLWLEKEVKSVANVTRRDIREFLPLAAKAGIRPEVTEYALADANRALLELRQKGARGARVLAVGRRIDLKPDTRD